MNESRPSRDERVNQVIVEYLQAVENGAAPDRHALLSRHPELADELAAFFRDREQFVRAAADLSGPTLPDHPTLPPTDAESGFHGAVTEPELSPGLTPEKGALGTIRYFGDYEILEEIARGGMGVVYKARQVSLSRVVALKMILAGHLASPSDVQRFRTEAEAAANLDHPNIVPIYEVGEHEGQQYFSMKLVEGGNLAQSQSGAHPSGRDERQRPLAIAALMVAIARAVHYAHQRGIFHRDLKPANILLAKGTPFVTDFGLAKRTEGDSNLSQSGAIVGTPAYMAPEQAAGRKDLTTAIDVYSLGAILYELLTGRAPFVGPSPLDIVMQVVESDPVRPSQVRPDIDRDLETICLKCLEKDPQRRYNSAESLAADLERFQAGEPILARPAGKFERAAKWAKRRPALASLVAVCCVAAATLAGVILDSNVRLGHERDHARDEEVQAGKERDNALAAKTEADRQRRRAEEMLSHSRAERGMRLLEAGNSLGLLDLLEARRAAEDLPHLRETRAVLWSGWEAAGAGRLLQALPNKSPATAMAFAPNGTTLATRESNGTIVLWDIVKAEARSAISTPEAWTGSNLVFAADGKTLRFTWGGVNPRGPATPVKGGIQAWDVVTGKALCPPIDVAPGEVAGLSPDGRWLVTCAGAELQKRDAATNKPAGPSWKAAGPVEALAFSPDGKLLVTLSKQLQWWDAATGDQHAPPTPALDREDHSSARIAFSPNGKWLICRFPNFTSENVRVHETASGKPLGPPLIAEMQIHEGVVTVSPDGAILAMLSVGIGGLSEGSVRLWRTATGKPHVEPILHDGEAGCLAISPDGKLLATGGGDGTVRFWEVETARRHGSSLWHAGPVEQVAFAPDSSMLATRDESGAVRLWQTVAGPTRGKPVLDPPASSFAFGPGGRWLAAAQGKEIRRWDLTTFQPMGKPIGLADPIGALAASPDGALLAAGSGKGIQIWDVAAARPLGKPLDFKRGVLSLAFSADSSRLVAMSHDGAVQIWNPMTGKLHDPPFNDDGLEAAFFDLQIGNDGNLVATRCTFGIFLWRTGMKERLPLLEDKLIAALSPDGKLLVANYIKDALESVSVEDGLTGRTLARLPLTSISLDLSDFSPDGKLIAVPTGQSVQLWNAATGKKHGPRLMIRQQLQRLVFAPDSRRLITVSPGGTLRLWDVASGQQMGPAWDAVTKSKPDQPWQGAPPQAAFSADGRWLATLAADGHLRLWPLPRPALPLREMELRTWLATGVRLDDQGAWQSIPGAEWQALGRELKRLEKKVSGPFFRP